MKTDVNFDGLPSEEKSILFAYWFAAEAIWFSCGQTLNSATVGSFNQIFKQKNISAAILVKKTTVDQ